MLLRKSVIVLVLSVLVVAMAAASVSAASAISNNGPSLNNLKSGTGGYVVTFGKVAGASTQSMSVSPMSSLGNTIIQGQSQWAQKVVVGNPTTIYTDVYWGNPVNSISVTVYTPDGYVLGPYYDNIEGKINGDIPLAITRPGGVSSGAYYYQMYGYRISGSQYYTFS